MLGSDECSAELFSGSDLDIEEFLLIDSLIMVQSLTFLSTLSNHRENKNLINV